MPSPDGSLMPPLSSLQDVNDDTWTLSAGTVQLSGIPVGFDRCVQVKYVNETIFVKGDSAFWWEVLASGERAIDPVGSNRPAVSAQEIPPLSSFQDASGNTWTLVGSDVRMNSVSLGFPDCVGALTEGGNVYVRGTSSVWHVVLSARARGLEPVGIDEPQAEQAVDEIIIVLEPSASVPIVPLLTTYNVAQARAPGGEEIEPFIVWAGSNAPRTIVGVETTAINVSGTTYRCDLIASTAAVTATYSDIGIEWAYA